MPSFVSDEILQELDRVDDWAALIKQMIAYAVTLAQREYGWRVGSRLPKGDEIKDIVFRTVEKLYSGERTWDPEKVPLKVWLRNNIRSEMNNLFTSAFTRAGERREIPLTSTDDGRDDKTQGRVDIEPRSVEDPASSPEDTLIEKEEAKYRQDKIDALYGGIQGDDLLENIFYLILGGCERKPRVLAERLGVPRGEVNNALRRLDRQVRRIGAKNQGGGNG